MNTNKPHIVLIDPHGTVFDYAVDSQTLASVFTQLQTMGERMPQPMLKPEYLTVPDAQPAPIVEPEPEPNVPDITPLYESGDWTLYHGLTDGMVEIAFADKPDFPVREELRRAGYRWNAKTRRWYGRQDNLPAQYWRQPVQKTGTDDTELVEDMGLDIPAFGERCGTVTIDKPLSNLPAPGTVVRLTGGYDEPSIARGDPIEDCTVEDPPKTEDKPQKDDEAFLSSLKDLFGS